MQLKLKIFQTISEVTFPILGYLFWNWTLFDITLFYFLDLLVSSVFLFVKVYETAKYQSIKINYFTNVLKLLFLYFIIILIGTLIFNQISNSFHFWKEFTRFFMLKDMGISQGIILFPLIFYAGYMQYKMKFIQTNQKSKTTVTVLFNEQLKALFILIGGLAIVFAGLQFIKISNEVLLFILVFCAGLYSFFWKN